MSPEYAKNAPQGYMGDWSRGAPLGRSAKGDLRTAAELEAEFVQACVRLSDALRLKENRPADGYKAACWEAAAEAAREEKEVFRALHKAATARESAEYAPKVTLRRVRIDSQGYDPEGAYFGINNPIYWAATDDGAFDWVMNAATREEAKAQVRKVIPYARFSR
jgi:hypothetical protein